MKRWLAAAMLTFGVWSVPAVAQAPSPLAEWQYSSGIALIPRFVQPPPDWTVALGGGAGMLPQYDGASDYRVQGGPMVEIRKSDEFFFSLGEGLGYNFLTERYYRFGFALTYDLGRREKIDRVHLAGLGNIEAAPEGKLFYEYVFFPGVLRIDARHAWGGHNGWIGDVSLYSPVAGNKKFFVFVGPSVTFADGTYLRHYFGVSPQQSLNSGYAQYRPHGGLQAARIGSTAVWFFTEHWMLNVLFAYERLLGDTRDSPIVQTGHQYTGSAYVGYNF